MSTRTGRRVGGVALVLALAAMAVIVAVPALGSSHTTEPWSHATNQASYWKNYGAQLGESDWVCFKVENKRDVKGGYVLGTPPSGHEWRLIVVKAGADHNDLYWNPTPGVAYAATGQGAGGWSHVILCKRPIEPTEPTVPVTEPTEPTEPTVPVTEPTEPTEPTVPTTEPTETTEPTDTTEPTETSQPSDTTPTEEPPTDSSTPGEEEPESPSPDPEDEDGTTPPEVEGETTSTTAAPSTGDEPDPGDDPETEEVTTDTLPFTGLESGGMAVAAALALAAGAGLVLLTRGSTERGVHLRR